MLQLKGNERAEASQVASKNIEEGGFSGGNETSLTCGEVSRLLHSLNSLRCMLHS